MNQSYNIKELLSDSGTKFKNRDEKSMLDSCGIAQRLSTPYTPEQNANTETENRTVVEMARTFKYSNPNT